MKILLYGNDKNGDMDFIKCIGSKQVCRVSNNAAFKQKLKIQPFDYLAFSGDLFEGIEDYLAASITIAHGNSKIVVNHTQDVFDAINQRDCTVFDFHLPFQSKKT